MYHATLRDVVHLPVLAARVRTVGTFNFKYGRLEVEAKLPRGVSGMRAARTGLALFLRLHSLRVDDVCYAAVPQDWLWPAIWLLPENNAYGNWPASGEIDLMVRSMMGPPIRPACQIHTYRAARGASSVLPVVDGRNRAATLQATPRAGSTR